MAKNRVGKRGFAQASLEKMHLPSGGYFCFGAVVSSTPGNAM
jgi:hypothetical protein